MSADHERFQVNIEIGFGNVIVEDQCPHVVLVNLSVVS